MSDKDDRLLRRPIEPADEPFVFGVFAATHGRQFQQAGLPEALIAQLLEQQFRAQQSQFHMQYPGADYDLIVSNGVPIGYIYTDLGPGSTALLDIALLPQCCGQGTGTEIVGKLIAQAVAAGRPIEAHVAKGSRAWGLWQRLGFEVVADDGVHLTIIRLPADSAET